MVNGRGMARVSQNPGKKGGPRCIFQDGFLLACVASASVSFQCSKADLRGNRLSNAEIPL